MQKIITRYLWITVVLFIAGCDIFQTRDPEKPVTGRSSYVLPSTPELVVQNITNSLKEKNLQDYMSCFVDSVYSQKNYRFIPSTEAAARYPVFFNWTLKSESGYFNNVKSKLSTTDVISIVFNTGTVTRYADSAQYIGQYLLTIPQKNASLLRYEGQLRFTMIPGNGYAWVISAWEDFKSGSGDSWSDLKGLNY